MAEQKALIQAMGLSELDTDNDKFINNGKDYNQRKNLQDKILQSELTDNEPDGPDLWATEKNTAPSAGQIPKCHIQMTIAVVSATIPKGNSDGSSLDIPKEHILPKELAAEWSFGNISQKEFD